MFARGPRFIIWCVAVGFIGGGGLLPTIGQAQDEAQESKQKQASESTSEAPEQKKQSEQVESAEQAQPAERQKTLTLALAEQILEAAKAEAERQGWSMSFAVVDAAGRQVAMIRMDGARWMTARVAQAKAFTAATFRRPSAAVEELAEQRPDLFQSVTELIDEPMLLAGGGLPILIDGKLLGGVGASGGSEAEDIDCAQVGLDAIGAQ